MADIPLMVSPYQSVFLLLGIALLCMGETVDTIGLKPPGNQRSAANAAIVAKPPKMTQSTVAGAEEITISKASDGLFYTSGKINGTEVRFLIDTGANMVVLTADDARRIGLAMSTSGVDDRIETAGGQSQMARVSLDAVDVAGHHVKRVDAAVMENGLRVSLLGQNLLSKLGPINMAGDELKFQGLP